MEVSFDRILMDGISDMVFVMRVKNDTEFVYDFVNRVAMDSTGMTQDDLGKTIHEVRPPAHANLLYQNYYQVITTRKTVTFEDYFVTSTGEKQYTESTLTPLFDACENCEQIVSLTKNITKEKQAEFEKNQAWNKLNASRKKYKSLFHYNSDAIISLDINGHITNGNIAVETVTGYAPKELNGLTLNQFVPTKDLDKIETLFMNALVGNTEDSQLIFLHKTGKKINILLKVTPLVIDGQVIGIYAIIRDVSNFVTSQKRLEESEERFRIIAEYAHDLISLINDEGDIIYASPSYKKILGFDNKEYEGNSFLYNIHPDDIDLVREKVNLSIEDRHPFIVQFKQFTYNNTYIWSQSHGAPVFDDQNNFKHLVIITRDISLQKEYESKLKHFANHDPLTNLPNRRLFKSRLCDALDDVKQDNKDGIALIMMDIDHFKKINDTLGHDIGDSVIEDFGARISQSIRETDTVARLGGDEFVVLLPHIHSKENVVSIVEKIQKSLQHSWDIHEHKLEVTTSMGVVMASKQGTTSFSILKNADIALYEAKNDGRNTYKIRELT
ncbi:hypothetical protein GCM10011351_00630 [Paraliobacillus quinghaiensis]|uniref:Diguanylate cyclase n=1 Tax=Paraliobacillus quinghaiensis TaxID=470815 RepID=A0A917TDD9_9BACI|nr:sensor domain-containing diguanylate cyclase [Paraliobacillus quinghaiensis]GGM18700.1 hypothetical protein GCM10011351_00630 [Paraliobacillus quinghaiensis]